MGLESFILSQMDTFTKSYIHTVILDNIKDLYISQSINQSKCLIKIPTSYITGGRSLQEDRKVNPIKIKVLVN